MTESASPPTDASPADGHTEDDASPVRVVDKRWWARAEADADASPGGTVSGKPAYVEDLQRQLAAKETLLAEYAAKYTSAAKDFDQIRERLRRESTKDVEREKRVVLAAFLEVVDNLERAIDATNDAPGTGDAVLTGVGLVRDQCLATLSGFGVTRVDALGQRFDPNVHDALSTGPVQDVTQHDTVVAVAKPGYMVGDEVLRPASVTVGKLQTVDSS